MNDMGTTVLHCRSFAVPKDGHAADECEDAFACNNPAGRFAVADGASESIYAGEWARLLCEAFVADASGGDGIGPWLGAAQKRWRDHVRDGPAPWHVAEKLEDGAFATFLGLMVDSAGRWRAVATGDSCLFLVRDDGLRRAFPVEAAAAFGTRPAPDRLPPAGPGAGGRGRGNAPGGRPAYADDRRPGRMVPGRARGRASRRGGNSVTGRTATSPGGWVAGGPTAG